MQEKLLKKTNYLPTMKNSKVKIIDISGTYQYTNMIEFFSFVRFGFSFTRKSKGCAEKLCYFFSVDISVKVHFNATTSNI